MEIEELLDATPLLDEEIASARKAMAKLQALADAGDPVAKLLVQRMDAARTLVLRKFANILFGED